MDVLRQAVRKVKVKNAQGIHARPAAMIAKLTQASKSKVVILKRKMSADARSIMDILFLAITKNTQLTLVAEGEDAEAILDKLVSAFENKFGEAGE